MKRPSISQLVYRTLYPNRSSDDPNSFGIYIGRYIVPELRVEVFNFYGNFEEIEAKYPGLDYSYPPHRLRLGRFPHHRRLFQVFDALGLTRNELYWLCSWEGTILARDRFEQDQQRKVIDTTGCDIRAALPPKLPKVEVFHRPGEDNGATEDMQSTSVRSCTGDPTVQSSDESLAQNSGSSSFASATACLRDSAHSEATDGNGSATGNCAATATTTGTATDFPSSATLNQRLMAANAARVSGQHNLPLDPEYEQWLKEEVERSDAASQHPRPASRGPEPAHWRSRGHAWSVYDYENCIQSFRGLNSTLDSFIDTLPPAANWTDTPGAGTGHARTASDVDEQQRRDEQMRVEVGDRPHRTVPATTPMPASSTSSLSQSSSTLRTRTLAQPSSYMPRNDRAMPGPPPAWPQPRPYFRQLYGRGGHPVTSSSVSNSRPSTRPNPGLAPNPVQNHQQPGQLHPRPRPHPHPHAHSHHHQETSHSRAQSLPQSTLQMHSDAPSPPYDLLALRPDYPPTYEERQLRLASLRRQIALQQRQETQQVLLMQPGLREYRQSTLQEQHPLSPRLLRTDHPTATTGLDVQHDHEQGHAPSRGYNATIH
ncbi:hypothetical protein KEM52_002133 [Ascosphaera acerosa]|nr:hypothetical protein KEM52_002133 [Ascosphaera acerosa]